MKNNISRLLAAGALAVITLGATAQNTRSAYFIDGYSYRFMMNPAIANDKNFVAIPGLGNLNVDLHGNLHLTDVLYNVDGKTTTFLNPGVSADEVMKNIGDMNKIGTSENITILAGGFKAFGGYNTISIGARVDADIKVPGSLFSLMKNNISNDSYDLSGVKVDANAYAEFALGHSRQINKNIRVGGALKFLFGAGNVYADLRHATLDLGENDWTVTTDADIHSSLKGLTYKTDVNNDTGHRYVNGVDVDGAGLGGFGMAVDLGAVYNTPVKGLTVSASLLDLGFISWKNDMLATTGGVKTFNTDRYTFSPDDNAPNSFSDEWDRFRDDFSAIYELDDAGDQGGRTTALHATMNIGVEYELPVYRPLSFGMLNTTRFAGSFTWTDFRFSANIAPCKIFSAGVNLGAGTYGASFGWLLNLHAKGINFFAGMDHTPGKLAKQGVPLSSNAQVNLGLNVAF